MKRSCYPNFYTMSDEDTKDYIVKYIKKHFTIHGRLIAKLPFDLREDAIQAIFIDLYETRYKYDPSKAMFSTFAYYRGMGIVTKFLSQLNKQKPEEIPIDIPDNKHFIKTKIYRDQIKTLLRSLSQKEEKRIFFMRFIKKMNISTIAIKLKTNPNKIKKIIIDIQKKLDL